MVVSSVMPVFVAFVAFVALVTAVAPIAETICAAVAAVNALVPFPNANPLKVATPVPPLPTTKVPATETAPCVAVAGVNPVVPNEILETAELDKDAQDGAAPVLPIKIWPVVPAAVATGAPAAPPP